jgi:hypothetical protein
MQPRRSSILILALLLANAAAVLLFRYFITVDGPIHVLRASLLAAPWPTPVHGSQGIAYHTAGMQGSLGDRILMVLLHFLSSAQAHDVLAVMTNCSVVLAVIAFLYAHGTRMSPAMLWLAPFTFNILLLMGLFHFLLGTAIAFGSVAWWKWRAHGPLGRWMGLLIGVLLAWYTHRSAPILLCLLFIPTLLFELFGERGPSGLAMRSLRRWWLAGTVALLAYCLVMAIRWSELVAPHIPGKLPRVVDGLFLRPLFLVDHAGERWMVLAIGALFLVAIMAGALARYRMGRRLFWHDALPVLAAALVLLAWVFGTVGGRELLIAQRSEWLAGLVLVCWLAAMAGASTGMVGRVIAFTALCALPFQALRVQRLEEGLSHFARTHADAIQAAKALRPGSMVFPVMADPRALLQNLPAYVAIEHSGIVLPRHQRIWLAMPEYDPYLGYTYVDNTWLLRSWRMGLPEKIDQVLFLGEGIEQAVNKHPWPTLLKDRFRMSYDNGKARIYTVESDGLP